MVSSLAGLVGPVQEDTFPALAGLLGPVQEIFSLLTKTVPLPLATVHIGIMAGQ
jgi:hypothetical protein